MSCPVEVTNTCSLASLRVLVASTRNERLPESYSARVILTVSVAVGGGGGALTGLIVNVAERVMPLKAPLIVAVVEALTVVVLTVKFAEDAPAATVTDAGTVADALLLASVTTVADGAAALSLTVPCTVLPPVTDGALSESADNVNGAGAGVDGVTVTVTSRLPS